MSFFEAIVLAIVEGLTEFLPVSSTGHMIIASAFLGIEPTAFTKTFTVAIQLGAILAVVALYSQRFIRDFKLYRLLIIGVVPALVFGWLLNDWIDSTLERVDLVGYGLLSGGIILVFVDKWFQKSDPEKTVAPVNALVIGLFQCLAILLPGVSRSAATIIGGLTQKLSRAKAAEFSFLLAVPTMCAATGYKLLSFVRDGGGFTGQQIPVLILGNIVAFIVAWVAIRGFLGYLERHGFRIFGIYRIIAGLVILGLYYSGVQLNLL